MTGDGAHAGGRWRGRLVRPSPGLPARRLLEGKPWKEVSGGRWGWTGALSEGRGGVCQCLFQNVISCPKRWVAGCQVLSALRFSQLFLRFKNLYLNLFTFVSKHIVRCSLSFMGFHYTLSSVFGTLSIETQRLMSLWWRSSDGLHGNCLLTCCLSAFVRLQSAACRISPVGVRLWMRGALF